jgi:prolyl-tRNA editing enzyme YbaK/EbsC (Cys-tRNA(Pro) deacylase)
MSLETVKQYFEKLGLGHRIMEFPESSATVEKAAVAVGCEEQEIAKTMAFKSRDGVMLIVMAGDARIDNSKFKMRFHSKAVMLKGDEVEELIGHPAGGVCPFGISDDIVVYLDSSLNRFSIVYPACGSGNSAIGLDLEELHTYSNSSGWVDVSKGWNDIF